MGTEELKTKKETNTLLTEDAKDILYCFCIMEKTGELRKASWGTISSFCHIHTDKMLRAMEELKNKACINYQEGRNAYHKFEVLEKGMIENNKYLCS